MTPDDMRAWRKRLSLTQAQAAAALGISASQLTNYESGINRANKRPAPIPRAIALACGALSHGLDEESWHDSYRFVPFPGVSENGAAAVIPID